MPLTPQDAVAGTVAVPRSEPRDPAERLPALDVMRGVAVLGILPINVQSFAMVAMAMMNPTAYGDLSGANGWVFRVGYVLADQEFLTLFAMLFAAGMLMISDRVEAEGGRPAAVHYRRTFALLVIGAVHAYGFWENDVLFYFGQCALWIFLLRRMRASHLIVGGLAFYSVHSLLGLQQGLGLDAWHPMARWQAEMVWQGHPAAIQAELAAYRGTWLEQFAYRLPELRYSHTTRFATWTLWRIGGAMLLGMGLYRAGVLTGTRSRAFTVALAGLGLGLGLALRVYGLHENTTHEWRMAYARYFGFQYVYWGSLLSCVGWIGAITLWVNGGRLRAWTTRLAAVGRMSLSNYLLQTLICTTLFYGYGFGWFGSLERTGQLGVVLAIWGLQLVASPLWLRHFAFGPAEALWRSATYLRWPRSAMPV